MADAQDAAALSIRELKEYATSWQARAGDVQPVNRAIAALENLVSAYVTREMVAGVWQRESVRLQAEVEVKGKREVEFEGAIELLEKIAYSIFPDYAADAARQYLNQRRAAIDAAALSALCGGE